MEEQRLRRCTQALGVILYPTDSKTSYFLPLYDNNDNINTSDDLLSNLVTFDMKKILLSKLLNSDSITKISYSFHEVLQTLLFYQLDGL